MLKYLFKKRQSTKKTSRIVWTRLEMIWISQTTPPLQKNTTRMIDPPFARLDCDYNVVIVDCRACLNINMGVWIVALLKYSHSLPKPMFYNTQVRIN